MKGNGFSLIECMIYCFLFIMLVTTVFRWFTITHQQAMSVMRSPMHLACALDMFVRDVRMAPSSAHAWKKVTDDELIWQGNGQDIGWHIFQGMLWRYQGSYNASNDTWRKKSKNVVAHIPSSLAFKVYVETHESVLYVNCMDEKNSYVAAIRNQERI